MGKRRYSNVGCHNEDCVPRINRSAFPVRDMALIKQVQEQVANIRVSFINLVQENNTMRMASQFPS